MKTRILAVPPGQGAAAASAAADDRQQNVRTAGNIAPVGDPGSSGACAVQAVDARGEVAAPGITGKGQADRARQPRVASAFHAPCPA